MNDDRPKLKRIDVNPEVNTAIGYAVSTRFWQLFTGPITQFLIAIYFTPEIQGCYFAFLSMLGIQQFFELGLHGVLINLTSHEWRGLEFSAGRLSGDINASRRILSLTSQSLRWYFWVSIFFAIAAITAGLAYWTNSPSMPDDTSWRLTWVVLVLTSAIHVFTVPLTSILEGCHQLMIINKVRCIQAVAGTITVWSLLVAQLDLWTLVGASVARLLGEVYLLGYFYSGFICQAVRYKETVPAFNWKTEAAPLQWRMAFQGPLIWLTSHFGTLVVFHFHGGAEAGRIGMTLSVMMTLASACGAWIETRRPHLGRLIAECRFKELDITFFRSAAATIGLTTAMLTACCTAIWILNQSEIWLFTRLADRMLPFSSACILGTGLLSQQVAKCTNIFVRSHKKEPFLPVAILVNGSGAILVYFLTRPLGPAGFAIAFALTQTLIQLPCSILIFRHACKQWRPLVF